MKSRAKKCRKGRFEGAAVKIGKEWIGRSGCLYGVEGEREAGRERRKELGCTCKKGSARKGKWQGGEQRRYLQD